MTLADKFTSVRLILTPVFFVVYFLDRLFPEINARSPVIIAVLWLIFIITEISDFFDGFIARKLGEVSDFGKLYDPFADTLAQLTYFFCFVQDGILLPAFLFLVILYREFGILFLRNLFLQKGISLGARLSGKIKTFIYIVSIGFALITATLLRLCPQNPVVPVISVITSGIFILSALISVFSFFDYIYIYKKK